MHVVTNRRRGASGREYVTHLLRRTYREGGKVKNETVANLSHLPEELVELVRRWLVASGSCWGWRSSRSSARCRTATSPRCWGWRAGSSWRGCSTARPRRSARGCWP